LYLQVCSGKEFRKHSARRVPSARRHRLPFPKIINHIRKALPKSPTPSAVLFSAKKGNRMRKALPEIPNTVSGTFFCEKR
jgi:hypothetical protein